MRWFKHMTNMRNDLFIKKVVSVFGLEGKAVWDLILEIYAEACDEKNCGGWITFDRLIFRREIGISDQKMVKFLRFFGENSKLSSEIFPEAVKVKIPKMLDYRDEYSRKQEKKSGFTPDSLRHQNTEEQNTEEPPTPPGGSAEFFQKVFAGYPRQTHRQKAEAKWRELDLDSQHPEILAGIQRWGKSTDWQKEKGRFVPRMDKFLRERHWLEHPQPAQEAEHPQSKPKVAPHLDAWKNQRPFRHLATGEEFATEFLKPINPARPADPPIAFEVINCPTTLSGRQGYFKEFEIL